MMKLTYNKQTFWLLNLVAWFLLGAISLMIYYPKFAEDDFDYLGYWLTYVSGFVISLLLREIYRRLNFQKLGIVNLSILIFAASLIFSNIWFWFDLSISAPFQGGFSPFLEHLSFQSYLYRIFSHTLPLLTWSGLYFGMKFWFEWDLQRRRTEQANALAQSAQLQMLRYQLNPHFLFNALNSIRALIEEDKKNAKNMITELSEFLRYSLISKNYSNVPLINEIEAIKHYFAIEKKRYEEKLLVNFEIDPLAEDFPVLSFLIHPLTENAVKYGMQTCKLPLKINVSATVKENTLILVVCNSGKWLDPEKNRLNKNGTGTGLKNVRQRLENAFPNRHKINIEEKDDTVCVKIEIEQTPGHKDEQ